MLEEDWEEIKLNGTEGQTSERQLKVLAAGIERKAMSRSTPGFKGENLFIAVTSFQRGLIIVSESAVIQHGSLD